MISYIPDGTDEETGISRTTHLAISAHQDDVEFMAYAPIAECFGQKDKHFGAIIVTDGAGSPRSGLYADYTDEEMKAVRIVEQKKAAFVGEYSFLAMLGYPSKAVKDAKNEKVVEELAALIRRARPKYLYTHNLADKHETHVATALRVIAALRMLSPEERPEKVYGCEVWRDLDWVCDDEKVYLDCGAHPNLMRCLSAVFDSQIAGGKRYDLAAEGRRLANATFSASHACDTYEALNYAMDLTPLMDENTDIVSFISGHIERFRQSVREKIKEFE
ncbi:MAG TPA: PIG-L family deacetylase [Firmicutes bacterium]|nr:PIG-L family deacetylase [Bacillota bacterium]